jgi:hypothetical protein
MTTQLLKADSDLLLHEDFIDEKDKLKSFLGKAVDLIVNRNQNKTEPYFIVFHEMSDAINSRQKIRIENSLPGFVTNQIVFWVNNSSGICEWLWTVPPKENGKLRVEFNTTGVAYLQAKGAMPS